jgi:hypothetical protein
MTRLARVYENIPGLDEALLASDYAEMVGSTKDRVVESIRQRKLLGVSHGGEWYVVTPPFYADDLNRINRRRRERIDEERAEQAKRAQQERQEQQRHSQAEPNSSPIKDERHYKTLLGLPDQITPEDLTKRYRELVTQYHPDKVSGLGPKIQQVAEEEMKEINAAYEFLKARYGTG